LKEQKPDGKQNPKNDGKMQSQRMKSSHPLQKQSGLNFITKNGKNNKQRI
jgi:hypothetical protein